MPGKNMDIQSTDERNSAPSNAHNKRYEKLYKFGTIEMHCK